MKKNKVLSSLLICLILLIACSEESEKTRISETEDNKTYIYVDEEGGNFKIDSPANPLFSTQLYIPEKQFLNRRTLSIEEVKIPAELPEGLKEAGPAVDFQPEGLIFNPPATICLPYKTKDKQGASIKKESLKALYYDPISRKWLLMPTKENKTEDSSLCFETEHFSVYMIAAKIEREETTYPDTLVPGEYFLGQPEFRIEAGQAVLVEKGNIGRTGYRKGNPFHLYAYFHAKDGLIISIDQLPSINATAGYRAYFNEDSSGAIFDSFEIFDKIKGSKDARKWRWEAVFVPEHTKIKGYTLVDTHDPYARKIEGGNPVYAKAEAINEREVFISWGDLNMEMIMEKGNTLCIAFEAIYTGG